MDGIWFLIVALVVGDPDLADDPSCKWVTVETKKLDEKNWRLYDVTEQKKVCDPPPATGTRNPPGSNPPTAPAPAPHGGCKSIITRVYKKDPISGIAGYEQVPRVVCDRDYIFNEVLPKADAAVQKILDSPDVRVPH